MSDFDATQLKPGDRAVLDFPGCFQEPAFRAVVTIKEVTANLFGDPVYDTAERPRHRCLRYPAHFFHPFDPRDIPIGSEVYLNFEGAHKVRAIRRIEGEDFRSGVGYAVEPNPRSFGGNGYDSTFFSLGPPEPANINPPPIFFFLFDAEDARLITFGDLDNYDDEEAAFFEDDDEAKDHAEQYALAHPGRDIAVLRVVGTYRATATVTFTPAG